MSGRNQDLAQIRRQLGELIIHYALSKENRMKAIRSDAPHSMGQTKDYWPPGGGAWTDEEVEAALQAAQNKAKLAPIPLPVCSEGVLTPECAAVAGVDG